MVNYSKYKINKEMYFKIKQMMIRRISDMNTNITRMTGGNNSRIDELILNDLKEINHNLSSKKYMNRQIIINKAEISISKKNPMTHSSSRLRSRSGSKSKSRSGSKSKLKSKSKSRSGSGSRSRSKSRSGSRSILKSKLISRSISRQGNDSFDISETKEPITNIEVQEPITNIEVQEVTSKKLHNATFKLNEQTIDFKNKIPNVTLKGKYLKKYETFLTSEYYQQKVSETGLYEYLFKLLQHLNECGLNRTKQLYGTCWLNTIINCIIFGKNLRYKFLQLLGTFKKKDNDFMKNVMDTNKSIYKIGTKIEKNENMIFKYIVSILYKILCDEGLRNEDPNKYENFSLTNLAISLRSLPETFPDNPSVDTVEEIIRNQNLHYNVQFAFDMIIEIFNKNISTKEHQTIDNTNSTIINIDNTEHLNVLFFYIYNYVHLMMTHSNMNYDVKYIQNIKVNMMCGSFDKEYIFDNYTEGFDISNLENIEFILLTIQDYSFKCISDKIICTVNNKETIFKLECASVIFIAEIQDYQSISHAMTGFICNNEYYIYESTLDLYFKIDWRDLNTENFKELIYLYYPEVIFKSFTIILDPVIYYNTHINFSYDLEGCTPHRPDIIE